MQYNEFSQQFRSFLSVTWRSDENGKMLMTSTGVVVIARLGARNEDELLGLLRLLEEAHASPDRTERCCEQAYQLVTPLWKRELHKTALYRHYKMWRMMRRWFSSNRRPPMRWR